MPKRILRRPTWVFGQRRLGPRKPRERICYVFLQKRRSMLLENPPPKGIIPKASLRPIAMADASKLSERIPLIPIVALGGRLTYHLAIGIALWGCPHSRVLGQSLRARGLPQSCARAPSTTLDVSMNVAVRHRGALRAAGGDRDERRCSALDGRARLTLSASGSVVLAVGGMYRSARRELQ